ncbi:hypothetical protein ONS95_013626 [Cadophora gregata]|uniref:uncharacterized protein n=1 Tax=Cadophora gregata TaxID=51156 RepID=UPI0026DB6066|nr:uncharacterized protein ONS95_013626 [Cadophora gregata]KAK0113372.1 hypothetical protein ONS96_014237 [Cadophora gregata f. sp. sojae]KAK0114125.1 hypothetical protein ONS95_013626 [Cadophora gregata]
MFMFTSEPKALTLSSPPLPNTKQEVKAISPAAGSILDAVGKVAAALLDGGSDIANLAEGVISSLSSTVLAGAPSQVPSQIQDVNSQVDQATGVVGGIVTAATGIVGSLLAGTGASGLPAADSGERNASTSATTGLAKTTSGLNATSSTSSMAFNITSAPVLKEFPSTSATSTCPSIPTCTACPAAKTETCTVTETWHSTHYESTATLFSFVAAFTYTCTETVSVCPKSSLYPLAPSNIIPIPPVLSSLIACPNGALAKRAEDCPPVSSLPNQNSPNSNISFSSVPYPDNTGSSHPCPNAGYSCSECPGGVFCPPTQTSAQDCVCGYGWACGHCSQGWFCIPSPTTGPANGPLSSFGPLSSAGPVRSAVALLGNGSASRIASPSVPSTLASFTANLPSLSSLPSAVSIGGSGTGLFQLSPTLSGSSNQAASTGDLDGNIINNVNSALGNINGLSGVILSSVMGQLSSVLGANFPFGIANPTNLSPLTGPAANLISSVTGAAAIRNPAGGLIPSATGLVGSVEGNVLSNIPSVGGNPAAGLIPTATGLVESVAGNVLSNIPSIGGNPVAGLVPTAVAIVSGVASDLVAAGVPGPNNPAGGLVPTASAIIAGVNSDLLAAGIPVATPAPIFQPTVTLPVVNNVLPILGKAIQEVTRTVIPQPLRSTGPEESSATDIVSTLMASIDDSNVISHLTTMVQGTPTILPVVITVLNGKPTVVPLVKMVVDGREKDLPVVGVDLHSGVGKVEAVKEVLDGNGDGSGRKRRRGKGVA